MADRRNGEARRKALVETAAQMFLEVGFDAVSLDALIARVGGSRRNIYDAYGGKEGLFIEVVTKVCEEYARPIVSLELDDSSVGDALLSFGRQLLSAVLEPRACSLQRLMVAEGHRFPDLARAIWRSGQEKVALVLAAWMEARQGEGRMRRDLSAKELAQWFIDLLVIGPQLRMIAGIDAQPVPAEELDRIAKGAVDLFLHGAKTSTPTR